MISASDTQGGFHGDGTTFIVLDCADVDVLNQIKEKSGWRAFPLEDTAIHKSVGIYVDPEHREKAKASNCYQRHYGLYFPQPSELVTPVFREDHKARQLYFEWQDSLAEDPDFLSRYASAVLSDLCRQETS